MFWARSYVDDTIGVEPLVCARGSRCLRASASLASDHFHLFGSRLPTDPPLVSSRESVLLEHLVGCAGVDY